MTNFEYLPPQKPEDDPEHNTEISPSYKTEKPTTLNSLENTLENLTGEQRLELSAWIVAKFPRKTKLDTKLTETISVGAMKELWNDASKHSYIYTDFARDLLSEMGELCPHESENPIKSIENFTSEQRLELSTWIVSNYPEFNKTKLDAALTKTISVNIMKKLWNGKSKHSHIYTDYAKSVLSKIEKLSTQN